MTSLGNNLHKLEYHIPTYYGFGSNVTVQKLAFVFRNANGTVVGRAADGSDIYYDIYPANAGLIAQFMKPESTLLISPTDSLETVVAASRFCDLKVYDNGTLVFQDSSKQETFYLSDTVPGMHTVILEATDSSTTVYDTIQYAVEPPLSWSSTWRYGNGAERAERHDCIFQVVRTGQESRLCAYFCERLFARA